MYLGLLIVIIFSVYLSIHFKKNNAETIFMSIAGIIFTLYLFGILKVYIVGFCLILVLALFCLVYDIYYFIKNKNDVKKYINFSMIGFLFLSFLIYYIVKDSKLICLDEFTSWGLFAKDTFYSKDLYIYSELPALAKNYQAGTAIFQSFFEMLNFKFSEDLLFMGNNVIYLSMGAFILKNKGKFLHFIFNLIIILMVPLTMLMWPTIYYSILVDIILGFAFAYILFYYFNSKLSTFSLLNISLAIFFICCSKLNGILLALVCLVIIYLDFIVFKRHEVKKFIEIKKEKNSKISLNIKKILLFLLPIFSLFFTYFSWNIVISLINVQENVSTSVTEILFAFKNENFKNWFPDFIETVKNIIINYKYFILLILATVLLIFKFLKIKKINRLRFGVSIILYILAHFAYIYFLFLVCSTMINSSIAVEALRRYLYTLVAADIFLITYGMLQVSYEIKMPMLSILLLVIMFSSTDASYQTKEFLTKANTYSSIEYRDQFQESISYLKEFDTENNIVYILSKDEVTPYIINYELVPGSVSYLSTDDINEIINKESYVVYNLNISTDDEQEYLNKKRKGDIYIYVYDFDESLKEEYEFVFESPIKEKTMYKIDNVDGVNKAVYVE